MKLVRLKDIILYHIIDRITLPDSERNDIFDEGTSYKAIIQYLDDEVAVSTYGADIDKVYRIATINNELEHLLIPKVQHVEDNISNYIIRYDGHDYLILRVTPKYIDMQWR